MSSQEKLFRIKYQPFGIPACVVTEDEEDFKSLVNALIANRVWFDVDFPDTGTVELGTYPDA